MSVPSTGIYRCTVAGGEHVYDGLTWSVGLFRSVLNSRDVQRATRQHHYAVQDNARAALAFCGLVPSEEAFESDEWPSALPRGSID